MRIIWRLNAKRLWIMTIYVFSHFSQKLRVFLLIWWLEHFQKATFWYIDIARAWNSTCWYYIKYKELPINFRSYHDSRRLKIRAQNHTIFCHAKISGISKGSEKMSTRFLICIWWFCIAKRFLTIPFHKTLKFTLILDILGSKKAFRTEFWVLGPNFRAQLTILLFTENYKHFNNVIWKSKYLLQKKKCGKVTQ